MKNFLTICTLSLVLSLASAAVYGTQPLAPAVSISTRGTSFKSGSDIRVYVTVVNTSTAPIKLAIVNGQGKAEFGYEVGLTREDNKPVARTDYGSSLIGVGDLSLGVSERLITLQSSQSYSDYFLANKLFNFDSPGVYLLRVRRSHATGTNEGVESNSIRVVVE